MKIRVQVLRDSEGEMPARNLLENIHAESLFQTPPSASDDIPAGPEGKTVQTV